MKKIIQLLLCIVILQVSVNGQEKKTDMQLSKKIKLDPAQMQTANPLITTPKFVEPVELFPDAVVKTQMTNNGNITIKMTKNIAAIPKNLGGVVKETMLGQSAVSEGEFDKKTTRKTINAESTTFMDFNIAQQTNRIYPGAIHKLSDFFSGGQSITSGRNSYTIYTDNTNNTSGSVSENVAGTLPDNCYNAIRNITSRFSTTTGSANLQYRCFRSSNDADLSIKISANGAYAGFSANGGYNQTTKETTLFLTIDAIKPMYTINTQIPTGGYLSDKNLAATPGLMVINSVTYGTRILANLRVTIKQRNDEVNFGARYGVSDAAFVAATFSLIKNNNSVESTVNAYVVGGPITTTTFSKDNLEQEINALLTRCNYQTAQPISYTFSDLNGNQLGAQTATDAFDDITSVPKDRVYRCTSASVEIKTNDDNKENGSDAQITLKNNAGIVLVQDGNNTEFPNNSTNTIGLPIDPQNANALMSNFESGDNNELHIFLTPKQIFLGYDVWNIKEVTLYLTFTDQFGNIGAVKTIKMNNANVRLEKDKQRLVCSFGRNYQSIRSYQPQ